MLRRRGGAWRAALALSLAAAAAVWPLPAAAQMQSPLKGQGSPDNTTTDVYVSVYLDRLLQVDERDYRHESITYFYVTWNDPGAYATVLNTTAAWLAGARDCERECTDWAAAIACCDDIFVPSFTFRNVYGFPQDRVESYKMAVLPTGDVAWFVFVHATYFQPMDLSHFPFDSWDLLITLEMAPTERPGHPGLRLHPSSGGTSLFTTGKGDPVSQWGIDGISLTVDSRRQSRTQPQEFVKLFTQLPSDPSEPLGLTTTNASLLRGCVPGATNLAYAGNITTLDVKIRISRFWQYHVLNTVLPVLLLGLLSFVVFFLERSDLASRLGIVVTLFLAMAAVLFVISESQPASSYVLPTQQASIATYVLLSLIAVESIAVYRIETWQAHASRRATLAAARARHVAARRAAKTRRAAEARGDDAWQQPGELPEAAPPLAANGTGAYPAAEAGDAPAAEAAYAPAAAFAKPSAGVRAGCWGLRRGRGAPAAGSPAGAPGLAPGAAPPPPLDPLYDAWLAYVIDRCALVALCTCYVVAIILIYTLNNGYIDLWAV